MKRIIILICLLVVNIGCTKNSQAIKADDNCKMIRKIWENRVRYYQFIDKKYLVTREGSMHYHIYELNHVSGQLKKIIEIKGIGFRVDFAIDGNNIYIVYQTRDYPKIEQVIECRSLITRKILWSQTMEQVKTINLSYGCLYLAKEKLIFLQMGLEEDKYDLVIFDKNQGNILSKIKLNGYNYYVKPLILEDKLIIATTNDDSTSWLTQIDLAKLTIDNIIELTGIINGTYTEAEKVFWRDGIFYAGAIRPGEGRAILKVWDDFSRYERIDCKIGIEAFCRRKYNYCVEN